MRRIFPSAMGTMTFTLSVALVASGGLCQPVVWDASVGGNGHTYEAVHVPAGITWTQADELARQRGGYLATTTNQAEALFVYSIISSNPALWRLNANNNGYGPWIGAEQPPGSVEPAGGWRWITGEPWSYTRWQVQEPSNFGGNEDAVCFYALGTLMQNRWNDLGKTSAFPRAYVIEWTSCCPSGPDLSNPDWNEQSCAAGDATCRLRARRNHCYQYATNEPVPGNTRNPGGLTAGPCDSLDAGMVIAGALSDGLISTQSTSCGTGCVVALWVRPGRLPPCGDADYHWWRKNDDATWSEKRGDYPAQLVLNPQNTSTPRDGYQFVSYFCVPCGFQYPGAVLPADEVPPNAMRVSLRALSGITNPRFETQDAQIVNLVRSALTAGPLQPPAPPPNGAGFTGFDIEVGNLVQGIPPIVEVRSGQVIYMTAGGLAARQDVLGVAAQLDHLATTAHGLGCVLRPLGSADFNHDGDVGTDADIEDFFACLAGNCCPLCGSIDINRDGDIGTDADIESFFRALAGSPC